MKVKFEVEIPEGGYCNDCQFKWSPSYSGDPKRVCRLYGKVLNMNIQNLETAKCQECIDFIAKNSLTTKG